MKNIIRLLEEINQGEVGFIVYSLVKDDILFSKNHEITIPLASAAKLIIGFCITKMVEEEQLYWHDSIEVEFDANEDSKNIYPHFQDRNVITLHDAVEIMIACHDNHVARKVVHFSGGWDNLNQIIKTNYNRLSVSHNPMDTQNSGTLSQLQDLTHVIYLGYRNNPELWLPIINGLVRQQGDIPGIPSSLLNHMSGGLEQSLLDVGILGEFSKSPLTICNRC